MSSRLIATHNYIVQPMTADHLDQVAELEKLARLSLWGREAYAEEIRRAVSVMLVAHGAQGGGATREIYGFIAARLNADELHINNIAVSEVWRRRGIGRALLAAALAAGKNIGAVWAVLEVRASNLAAQTLYARQGFEIVGGRKDYYAAPTEDATVMGLRF